MSDFRELLYENYVSNFKKEDYQLSNETIESFYKWYDYRLLPHIKSIQKNAEILDVGCGNGLLLTYLRERGYENLFGIDISEEQIKLAEEKQLNVSCISFDDFFDSIEKKYQLIFCMNFIEHFSKNEIFKIFKKLNNALERNGILVLQTPNGDGIFSNHIVYGDLTHLTIFNDSSLKQVLLSTDFKTFNFFEVTPAPKNISGIIRLVLWKVINFTLRTLKIIECGRNQKLWTENLICIAKKSIK